MNIMILTEKEAKLESKKDLQRVGIDLKEVSFCVEREKILDDLIKENKYNTCKGEQNENLDNKNS